MKDPHRANTDSLIDTFVRGYYGEGAAPHILQYMSLLRSAALFNASLPMGEAFGVNTEFLTPHVVLDAAHCMASAERAARQHASSSSSSSSAATAGRALLHEGAALRVQDEQPRDGTTTAAADQPSHDEQRFVRRVVEAGLPIMHTVMRRWWELRYYARMATLEVQNSNNNNNGPLHYSSDGSWPYSESLHVQFETFSERFEAMGATALAEDRRNLTWLHHTLFDRSPPPAPPPPPSPPPRPPVLRRGSLPWDHATPGRAP